MQQAGINGTALADNNLSWGISQGYSPRDRGSGDASLSYQGAYGNASLGYGYTDHYQQVRYGASGSMVLHRDGLTLGQPLGATSLLVAVPGAPGIVVENGTGIVTDWRGYALVPYANMYRENRVTLDINRLDDQTDIDNALSRVIPTRGALIRANFHAHSGLRVLFTLTHNGRPLPFGSLVSNKNGNNSGIIDDQGQVFLSGLTPQGVLRAQWGKGADQQYMTHFNRPDEKFSSPIVRIRADCL